MEKYLSSCCTGPRKRLARRRKELGVGVDLAPSSSRRNSRRAQSASRQGIARLSAPGSARLNQAPPEAWEKKPPHKAKKKAVRAPTTPDGLPLVQACCRAALSVLLVATLRAATLRRSASTIQRHERGRQARKAAKVRREVKAEEEHSSRHVAARTIQSAQRRKRAKVEVEKRSEQRRARLAHESCVAASEEENIAALKIQSRARSQAASREVSKRRSSVIEAEALRAAAAHTRAEQKRNTEAAIRIQSMQRGRSARKHTTQRKAANKQRADQNAAATKIQSVHRGRAGRSRAKKAAEQQTPKEAKKSAPLQSLALIAACVTAAPCIQVLLSTAEPTYIALPMMMDISEEELPFLNVVWSAAQEV